MGDLSKLSLEDLQALKARDISKMSLEGLQFLKQARAKAPGGEENPESKPLLPDMERAAGSFGDEAGRTEQLQRNGFKEVKKNAAGDLIVKGDDGKFYKDATNFTEHPVNWAEAHLGKALPVIGMTGGAIGGVGLGSVPLAAGGSGVGEALRIAAGKHMGVYKGDMGNAAKDVVGETLGGATAEMGGKFVGALRLPGTNVTVDQATKEALEKLVKYSTQGAAKMSDFMTGGDQDALLRQFYRPDAVKKSLNPGNALDVALSSTAERKAGMNLEKGLISQAREKFAQQKGELTPSTQNARSIIDRALSRNAPNDFGESAMTPSEIAELQRIRDTSLVTQKEVAPAVKASQVSFEKQPSVLRDASGNPLESVRTVPGQEFTVAPAQTVAEPKQSVKNLQRTADSLQTEIPDSNYNKTITRSDKSIGTFRELLGELKDKFHGLDPDGLKKADARFHTYIGKSKILDALDNPKGSESFIDNLFGKNKGMVQEAAKDVIPNNYERAADIGAAKNLSNTRLGMKLGPSGPAIARMGVLGLSGAAGLAQNTSLEGLMLGVGGGGALLAATSPKLHQQLYYLAGKYGMPVIQKVIENPQLAPVLLDTADYRKIQNFGQNVWSSLKESQE